MPFHALRLLLKRRYPAHRGENYYEVSQAINKSNDFGTGPERPEVDGQQA
jgi:hypothetical protein